MFAWLMKLKLGQLSIKFSSLLSVSPGYVNEHRNLIWIPQCRFLIGVAKVLDE